MLDRYKPFLLLGVLLLILYLVFAVPVEAVPGKWRGKDRGAAPAGRYPVPEFPSPRCPESLVK
jgi:hypothetical protein